jgi:hypothetical protein
MKIIPNLIVLSSKHIFKLGPLLIQFIFSNIQTNCLTQVPTINITLKWCHIGISKKVSNFHHYSTWFLAPIYVLAPKWKKHSNVSEQLNHYFHHGNYAQITSKQSHLLYVHNNIGQIGQVVAMGGSEKAQDFFLCLLHPFSGLISYGVFVFFTTPCICLVAHATKIVKLQLHLVPRLPKYLYNI